jgi:hypothetical protein
MRTKQLRSRLTKLERAPKPSEEKEETKKDPFGFAIEPDVLEAMDTDFERLNKLILDSYLNMKGGYCPIEAPECHELRARIAERAKTIKCPPSYGFKEHWMDDSKCSLSKLSWNLPHEEKLQARVRMEVFRQTPEGQTRLRIVTLEKGLLGHAEYEELIQLLKVYPEPWINPIFTTLVAHTRERLSLKNLKERTERDQLRIKKREENRRRNEIERENKK